MLKMTAMTASAAAVVCMLKRMVLNPFEPSGEPLKPATRGVNVASFNVLCRGFERRGYATYVKEEYRAWTYRKELLRKLMLGLGCDLLAIQEAEIGTFDEDFDFMEAAGFKAVRPYDKEAEKGRVTLAKPAVFYNPAKLTLLWHNYRSRAVLCAFKETETGNVVYLANCHLEGHPMKAAARFNQVKSALKFLQNHQKQLGIPPEEANVIVCGDFNSDQGGSVCTALRNGGLKAGHKDNWNPDEVITPTDYSHPFRFREVYPKQVPTFLGSRPIPTSIDFIYTTDTFKVETTRTPLTASQLASALLEGGAPNSWHPSDHFPVAASLSFI